MLQPDSDDVIEATRLDRLRGLRRTEPQAFPETAHSALVLMKAIDDHLAGHPVIAADPSLYRLAYRAFESLFVLHQELAGGCTHPSAAIARV